MNENFPNLAKEIDIKAQKAQCSKKINLNPIPNYNTKPNLNSNTNSNPNHNPEPNPNSNPNDNPNSILSLN